MNDLDGAYYLAEYHSIKEILISIQSEIKKLEKLINDLLSRSTNQDQASIDRAIEKEMDKLDKGAGGAAAGILLKRAELGQLKESVPLIFLRPKTIIPDEVYNGIIACDTGFIRSDTEGNFKVAVSIDSKIHEFVFSRSFD